MGKIVLDAELKEKLHGMSEPLEVFDEHGKTLGYVLPVEEYRKTLRQSQTVPFTDEELERFRQAGGGGPLSDFWKRMGKV